MELQVGKILQEYSSLQQTKIQLAKLIKDYSWKFIKFSRFKGKS